MIIVQTDQQLVDHIQGWLGMAKRQQYADQQRRGATVKERERNAEAVNQLERVLELVKVHAEQAAKQD